jgi:hypothetical protein
MVVATERDSEMSEAFYAIRRTDGEPIWGDFGWITASGPDDWEAAELDSEYADDATEYELVRMTVEPVAVRAYPRCRESGCDVPAAFWGLCEPHAREDDPETVAEILAARVSADQEGAAHHEQL